MEFNYITVLVIIGAASLVGAFVETAARKQQDLLTEEMAKLERKLDEVLARLS